MQTESIFSYQPVELLSHPTRDDGRVDLDGQVTLHYADLGDRVVERTQNVSVTGMFVRTTSLRPPGTILRFELDLDNGLEPIPGRAEVMWVRRSGDGLFRPAGMGVRFIGLDSESQKLIRWSVDHKTRELRKMLHLDAATQSSRDQPRPGRSDLDDLRIELEEALGGEAPSATALPSAASESSALAELRAEVDMALRGALERSRLPGTGDSPREMPGTETRRTEIQRGDHSTAGSASASPSASISRRLWRIASAAPLLSLVALSLYFLSSASEPVSATPQVAEIGAVQSLEKALPISAPVAKAQDSARDVRTVEEDLEQVVMTWAEAWSEQRARSYLACYSPDFQPPGSLDRGAWERQREERILKPRHIQVEVSNLETDILSTERARVSFTQVYSSDRYRDTVRKTFDLIHGEQGWKILAERSETEL